MNLDERIRESIERQTTPSAGEGPPANLLRRARRRQVLNAGLAVLTVTALVAVGAAGFHALGRAEPLPPAGSPTAPAAVVVPAPPSSTPEPGTAAAFVDDFMRARSAGSGAEAFLSSQAADYYAARPDPALYGNADLETTFGDVSVDRDLARGDGTHDFLIRIQQIFLGDTPPCPVTERLIVGPGTDTSGGAHDLLVLSAERVSNGWEEGPLSALAAQEFACAFVNARLEGTGADPFLSGHAESQFLAGEGGLVLYAPTDSHWGFWSILHAEPQGDAIRVVITLNNTGQPDAIFEELIVGPGSAANGDSKQAVVRSAARLQCDSQSNECP